MNSLSGKRGLIMGVANDRSIAWGIAKACHAAGADLAFSYQGEGLKKRVEPLAAAADSDFAYSDKSELTGRFSDTSRANFTNSMLISCYSFVDVARRAADLMPEGGCLLTLTFQGSQRVTPNYNVMGVAKAALESATRYLAADLGPQGIRVNAISPGPMKTLAGAAISGARRTFKHAEQNAPLRHNATLEAVGGTSVYLASDAGNCTTGEVIRVDSGYHVMNMPVLENL
jgi:enoyl-[acyl-carrier protein] reductase I